MHKSEVILWIYIALLLVGGMIGFFKSKSRVSLITSAVAAAILILCAVGRIFQYYVADLVLGILLVVFAIRLGKTHKLMPAGFMLIITVIALLARNLRF